MTATVDLRARLAGQLEAPVVRAGLALVTSAGITSLLGLVYWSVAARQYSPAAVGAAAALLAAMELVAAAANLGLKTALIRFVPALGDRAARVVAVSYLSAGTVALAGAGLFVALHGRWFPELTLLDEAPGIAFFLLSTVLWVVFFLQDSVLVGLRQSRWVPVENALFAVAKLGLLVALTAPMPGWGIYVSWSAPLLAVVLAVNIPVFGLLRRGGGRADEELGVGDLVRFSAGDYAASGLWLATIHALPLLVLALATAADSAAYHLSWTVAYTLYLVSSAVGSALVAEGAHDPAGLEANARRAGGQALALVVPAAAVVVVGAPWILGLFGAGYADEATTLLRLVAASAVPHVVTGLYVNLERARRHIRAVIAVYAALGVGVVGASALLVPALGVTGAGLAWCGTQTVLALWLLATRLRDVWIGALPTPVVRRLGALSRLGTDGRRRRAAQAVIGELDLPGIPPSTRWSVLHATTDLVVARAGDRILKLPGSHAAELARRRELDALQVLAAAPSLDGWGTRVPRSLAHGTTGSQAWSLETAVEGTGGDRALAAGLAPDRLLRDGAAALTDLHRATAQTTVPPEALLASWIDEPATIVARARPDALPALAEVAATLRLAFADRPVTVAWSHGDLTPANVLVDRAGAVTGIVDWEGARADRLPEVDLVTLVAATRAAAATREFGEVVLDLLRRPWTEEEVAVLAQGPNADLPRDALVLLVWLHHVAANLVKSEAYTGHGVWLIRNVDLVLARLDTPTPAPPAAVPAAEPTTPPVDAEAGPRRTSPGRPWWPYLVPVIGVLGWFAGLRGTDVRSMTDTGLVSVVPPLSLAALGLIVVGFAVAATRVRLREGVVAAHLAGLVAVLFATPAVVYGTLRYSWAWKHVGIVEFIDRTGGVDPGIDVLPVYHNWPGFFAGSQALQSLVGADNVLLVARWAPLVLTLATVAAVVLLAGTFTEDRRVVWLTAGIFTLGNWVGQEYFSPQALAYLLYLVALALTLRLARDPRSGATTVVAVVLLAVAMASSHQLTPAMLTIALVALALARVPRVLPLAVVSAVATATWALWGASHYVGENLRDAIDGFGQPLANAEGNLADSNGLSDGQALVSQAGRLLVVLVAALALVGLVRRWVAGDRPWVASVLLVAPGLLLAGNSFGGEILFRVFLYALPVAAWFAAQALVDLPGLRGRVTSALAPALVLTVLAPLFLLAHFGKDGHYVFTPEEVEAATWVYDNAPPGSLLVEGSRNYPTQFRNYERFTYLPIDREDQPVRRELARRPVQTISRWMSYDEYTDGYLLLTRSQSGEADALGLRPAGLLDDLETALRASNRFEVAFENRDAVVFTLREATP